MSQKFWRWDNHVRDSNEGAEDDNTRTLYLYGSISDTTWMDDDVTPKMFRDELFSGEGDVVIFLNSPGGDCIAASQIYTMLTEYKGRVTIKIDGLAASAASVIAMAGDSVLMAPTGMMFLHNPMTAAFGNKEEMEKAIGMLEEVKESIINAYERKTGLSRQKLSRLMDADTWLNARRAIELGFADGMLGESPPTDESPAFEFSGKTAEKTLLNKITDKARREKPPEPDKTEAPIPRGRSVDVLMERLSLLKN